ncbi:hypothetical protein ABTK26_19970, partial [Acinetobacter baumannii]
MGISQNEVQLLYPISFTGQTPLPAGAYSYSSTFVNYKSDFRKPFSFFGNIGLGSFYNGYNQSLSTGFTIRKIPHLNLDF